MSRIVLCFILMSSVAFAGTPRQKAIAAVDVAKAQIQIFMQRAQLKDSQSHFLQAEPEVVQPRVEPEQFQGPIQDLEPEALFLNETPADSDLREPSIPPVSVEKSHGVGGVLQPMSISFPKVAVVSEVLPAQLVIEVWDSGCIACELQERDIIRVLTRKGWKIGDGDDCQIKFVHIPQTKSAPQSVLYQNGTEIQRWVGYEEPGMLSHALLKAWNEAGEHPKTISASGPAGAIQASGQIRQAIGWFRQYVGEGVTASLRWDRSGAQAFPLLAKGDFSAEAIFGKYGHFQVSAIGAKNLPIQEAGVGYIVDGEDIGIDADRIILKGAANLFSSQRPNAVGAAQPAQFGLMSLWTIFAVVRDVWSLLHPSCDLQLGGFVEATAVLASDAITVEFSQCPSIKLVALFTFQLTVKRVVITEKNVHVDFTGSRLVKSRDFAVQ